MSLDKVERVDVHTKVYRALRDAIYTQFQLGQKLDLKALENQLEVSRTPLMMALRKLESDRLVHIKSRSGVYVANPTPQEMIEALEVRKALEVSAAEKAIQGIKASGMHNITQVLGGGSFYVDDIDVRQRDLLDYQIHALIISLSGNATLELIWGQLYAFCSLMGRMVDYHGDALMSANRIEVDEVIHAFETRDTDLLKQWVIDHFDREIEALREFADGAGQA